MNDLPGTLSNSMPLGSDFEAGTGQGMMSDGGHGAASRLVLTSSTAS